MTDHSEKPPQPSAEESGAFTALEDMPESFLPILPLLKKTVNHMRASNQHQVDINEELIQLNASLRKHNALLWIGAFIGVLLVMGMSSVLYQQWQTIQNLTDSNAKFEAANARLEELNKKLGEVDKKAGEVKQRIDDQPKVTYKPADTSDPSSSPVLIVEPPVVKSAKPAPKNGNQKPDAPPETIEFPLGPPRKKK
jgi:hypothetical protein